MALEYKFTINADDSDRADLDQFMEGAKAMLQNWGDIQLEKPTA